MEDIFAIFVGVCLGHIVFYVAIILIDFIKEKLNKDE